VMPLPDTRASPSPAAGELGPADVRPSPTRISPTQRPSPMRISSPTHRPLPRCASPRLAAPAGPRPSSSMSVGAVAAPDLDCGTYRTVRAGQHDRYAAPPPPPLLVSPSVRPPAGVRLPRWPVGGLALLTPAREMMASASIFH
jgi:hypothetical protein